MAKYDLVGFLKEVRQLAENAEKNKKGEKVPFVPKGGMIDEALKENPKISAEQYSELTGTPIIERTITDEQMAYLKGEKDKEIAEKDAQLKKAQAEKEKEKDEKKKNNELVPKPVVITPQMEHIAKLAHQDYDLGELGIDEVELEDGTKRPLQADDMLTYTDENGVERRITARQAAKQINRETGTTLEQRRADRYIAQYIEAMLYGAPDKELKDLKEKIDKTLEEDKKYNPKKHAEFKDYFDNRIRYAEDSDFRVGVDASGKLKNAVESNDKELASKTIEHMKKLAPKYYAENAAELLISYSSMLSEDELKNLEKSIHDDVYNAAKASYGEAEAGEITKQFDAKYNQLKTNRALERNGIKNPLDFNEEDFVEWASKNNIELYYENQVPFPAGFKSKKEGGFLGVGGTDLATSQQLRDAEILYTLAKNNLLRSWKDKEFNAATSGAIGMAEGMYGGLMDNFGVTEKEHQRYLDAGLDPKNFVGTREAQDSIANQHKVASGIGKVAGFATDIFLGSKVLGAIGATAKGAKILRGAAALSPLAVDMITTSTPIANEAGMSVLDDIAEQNAEYYKKLQTGEVIPEDDLLSWFTTNAYVGLAGVSSNIMKTADLFLPDELLLGEKNIISSYNDMLSSEVSAQGEKANIINSKNIAYSILGELTQVGTGMLPNTILAWLTSGSSIAAQSLGQTGYSLSSAISTTINSWAKNPTYWSSFVQTAGANYETAIAEGATEAQAGMFAVLCSLLTSGIEVGSGNETLFENLSKGSASQKWQFFKNALEEGGEEVLQSITAGLAAKAIYDSDREFFSSTDDKAIINPTLVKDFALGVGGGALMGGAKTAAFNTLNTLIDARNSMHSNLSVGEPTKKINATTGNIEFTAESAIDSAIADVAKANSESAVPESGKVVPASKKNPVVEVRTDNGKTVSVNGEYATKVQGRQIYVVKGKDIGAQEAYYAIDSTTGLSLAVGETKSVINEQLKELKASGKAVEPATFEDGTENIFAGEVTVPIDFDSLERPVALAKPKYKKFEGTDIEDIFSVEDDNNASAVKTDVEVAEIDSPAEVDEAVVESEDEKIVVPEKKVDKVTYERAFTERKTTAVSESELSGDDVEVGKTITHSDLTQAVIDQALNSNDAATIKAAKDIQRRVYKNTDEMYRAVGRLAKTLGITGNDVIQSRAASIAQRYNDSNFGSTYAEFSNDLRQKFELAGDEIGIQALDYLDSIQAKSGQVGIDTVATDGVEYSENNRNRVVENYISGIQYAFRANGNKNTRFEVYYDNSEGAKRGEWKVDRKGNVTIRINGAKVRGAESATWVLTHELFHGAAKNNPGIVDRVIDTFREIGIYDDSKFDAYKAEYEAAEGKELTDEYIKEEIAADLMMDVMGNEELTAMFAQKSTKEDLNFIARFFRRFVDAIKKVFGGNKKYQQYVYDAEKLLGVFERAVKADGNKKISGGAETRSALIGLNKDGIEVYETSEEIKKLSYADRMSKFLDLMNNQYRGRTAKFVRNGHTYYALFSEADTRKNIYGDKRSDNSGWKAKINVGADGDIFTLVENSDYIGSDSEQGKNAVAHKDVRYWDYFVKSVQVDNKVYDLLANVRKTSDNQFVYFLQLRENKKIKPSPPVENQKWSRQLGAQQLYNSSISHPDGNVNTKSALSSKYAVTSAPAGENSVFDDKQRKDVIRALSNIAKQNGVARLDKDSFVTDAMGILEGALQTGIVSDGVVDELARCLYDYSREDAGGADLAGTYKDIRERINKVGKIYVPESVKNDIPDYDAFRKQFGTLLTTTDETALEVDKLYNDLKMDYPDIFTEDLVAGDQLQKLADILAEARKYKANDGLTHTSEIHSFDDVKTDFVEMADEMLDDISASAGIELVEESDVYAELAESGKDISSIEIPNELIMKDKLSDKQIQALLQKVKDRRNEYMYVQEGDGGSRRVKKYPNADKEYKFLQRLFSAETEYKEAQKKLRDAEKKSKSRDAEVDNKRLTDFTKGIANAFGFDSDASKTADVGRGLKGLYDAVSEYIKTGDDAALNKMVASVGSIAEKIADYSTSDVDIDKVGGYILDSFSNVAKGARGDVAVASANDIASLENGTMAALEGVQSVAEADYSGEVEVARKALYDATAKLRAQQVQPYFETVMDKFFDMQEAEIAAAEARFEKELADARAKGKEAVEAEKAKAEDRVLGELMGQGREDAKALRKKDDTMLGKEMGYKRDIADIRRKNKEYLQNMRDKAAIARYEKSEKRNRRKQNVKLLNLAKELRNTKTDKATKEEIEKIFGMLDIKAVKMSDAKKEDLLHEAWELKQLENKFDKAVAESLAKTPDGKKPPEPKEVQAIRERIARLNLMQIGDLTNGQVAELIETAIAIKHYIANQKYIIKSERRQKVDTAVKSAINGIKQVEAVNAKVDKKTGGTKNKKVHDNMLVAWLRKHQSARTNFKRWFGYDNESAFMDMIRDIERGEADYNMYKVTWFDMFDPLLNGDNSKKIREFTGNKAKTIELKLDSGKRLNVTGAMLVSIAANAKNKDFLRHVTYGGIVIPTLNEYYSKKRKDAWRDSQTVKLTEADVKQIEKYVKDDAYMNGWLEKIREFYKDSANAINKTSRLLDGFDKARVEFYFPLSVASDFTATDYEVPTYDVTIEGIGSLKERTGNVLPIRLEDCTRVVNRSIEDSARYAGLAVPMRNFKLVYNNVRYGENMSALKGAIHQAYGKSATEFIENFMRDVASSKKAKYDEIENFFAKAQKKLSKSAMAFNLRVATGNIGGLGVAEGILGGKAMRAAATLKNVADEETINKYTPYLAVRKAGGTSVEMSDMGHMNDLTKQSKGFAIAFGAMNKVDEYVTKTIWKASEAYVRQNNESLKVGSKEYYEAVAEIFNETILRTQPTDTVFDTPDLIRSKNVVTKTVTAFSSALMKYQTFLVDTGSEFSYRVKEAGGAKAALTALKNGTNKELEDAFKKFVRAQSGYLKSAIIVGINELLWGIILHDIDFTDEDDEFTLESMWEGFLDMIVGSYTGGVMFLDEAISGGKFTIDGLIQLFGGEKYFDDYAFDLELPAYALINDTYSLLKKLPETWEKYRLGQVGLKTLINDYGDDVVKFLGNATGLPLNDIKRYTVDVFKTGYVAARYTMSGGSQPVASYYRYKLDEDGKQYYTRQKMINKALEAMEAGDMDSYNAIRDDMIESKYASAETFDKELKKLQTSIELGKYGEVFTNVDKLATKAQNDFDRESTGEKAFRYEMHNRDKNFAKNAIDAIENDVTLSEKEKKAQIALVGEMIRGKNHTKTEGQKLAIRNYDEVGNKGIFDFNVWDKEYHIYVDDEKESVNLSAEDYIAYNTEFNDATEYLRLAIFGGEEAVKNHGAGIKEKYGSEPWMLLAEGLPKDATAAERAEFYIGATGKLENIIRASYTAKYFDDFEQDYSYLKESNPEKYAQVAENMSDIDSGKVATNNIFERELDGNSTYDREVFYRADDVIAKAEDLIEKLPKDKQASARKYLEDYIADFAFDRRKGGELLAKVFDEVYADTEVNNADDMYDLIDGIFDSWGEYASNRQYKDDKQYDADYSVEDFIKINREMEDADELMRLVSFGKNADVKDEIAELKKKYKNEPWMLVIESAIDNAPSTPKEQIDFYKSLKSAVKQNIRLDYGYDYIKEISSGNKDVDDFLTKADAAYKAGSLYDNDFTGAAKGQKNYYARQQSFVKNSLDLIDNNPLLSASQKKEQKDKLGEYARGLRYSPTLGQKYIMAEFDDYAKSAEEYNKYIDAEISRTGDDTLDKMHWDSAESKTTSKSKDSIPYTVTYSQPQYADMVSHMDKGEEYAALYIFGTNKELRDYTATLTATEKAWVNEGVSELNKEAKKIDKYIAKGILSKESRDAYLYYALVGKIKTAVRAGYRETVFDKYRKDADTPKGYYVKYNP